MTTWPRSRAEGLCRKNIKPARRRRSLADGGAFDKLFEPLQTGLDVLRGESHQVRHFFHHALRFINDLRLDAGLVLADAFEPHDSVIAFAGGRAPGDFLVWFGFP